MWQNSTLSFAQYEIGRKSLVNGSNNQLELTRSYSTEFNTVAYPDGAKQEVTYVCQQNQQPQLGNINLQNNLNAGSYPV